MINETLLVFFQRLFFLSSSLARSDACVALQRTPLPRTDLQPVCDSLRHLLLLLYLLLLHSFRVGVLFFIFIRIFLNRVQKLQVLLVCVACCVFAAAAAPASAAAAAGRLVAVRARTRTRTGRDLLVRFQEPPPRC